ncbi:MAG: Spy/CpxP family protein refolding chaperone [Akkermansiaceae bacterium]|jgi:hypothetical protein|nr:Spy/CpxP family protein refolding chaperone [Akkermansiaceae bacterium]
MKPTSIVLLATLLGICPAFPQQQGDERPPKDRQNERRDGGLRGPRGDKGPQRYSIGQATSDEAQLHTIAFNGLAFLTAKSMGECTFIPPGKVCDYFGFQYMRDIDTGTGGHNTDFLTRIADNVLAILNDEQEAKFLALASEQAVQVEDLAMRRFPVIDAFWRLRNDDLPADKSGLDHDAIAGHLAGFWELDARLSLRRAEVFADVLRSLDEDQKQAMAKLKFGDSSTWPEQARQRVGKPRGGGGNRLIQVLVMTYASEMFSWCAGSAEADVYFCPERHGTYFGGFYLKDMPVMGKRGASISTALTGDSGAGFLQTLTPEQRTAVTAIIESQRDDLAAIVRLRREISTELRRALSGNKPDSAKVLELARDYGRSDARLAILYAEAFAKVNRTLTPAQRESLVKLRNLPGFETDGAFLYSRAIPMPDAIASRVLFR